MHLKVLIREKEAVQKLINQFETHPNREALQAELKQITHSIDCEQLLLDEDYVTVLQIVGGSAARAAGFIAQRDALAS